MRIENGYKMRKNISLTNINMREIILHITVVLLMATTAGKVNCQTQMILITSKEQVGIDLAGRGKVNICLGYGQRSEYKLPSKFNDRNAHIHTYSDTTIRTVTIVGNGITIMDCAGNHLKHLDVSNNTRLTLLKNIRKKPIF